MIPPGASVHHATAVAVDGRGLMIRGASGRGKSGLALEMMARGAVLVADDRVIVERRGAHLWLSCPAPLRGMIEARGIGLLRTTPGHPVRLCAVLDLDNVETARMPQRREIVLHGQRIPLLHHAGTPTFPAALVQYLRSGRRNAPLITDQQARTQRVVLVTGPSGAGRSTAINALEDFGYEAIDNIPLRLIPRLLEGGALARPVALGVDIRNRDFSVQRLIDLYRDFGQDPRLDAQLLYLDCTPEVLARRYSETRRRHPLAPDESYTSGIAREIALLEVARGVADILVDTSELSPHDLRTRMENLFADATGQQLAVSVQSFSYKRGLPQGLDWVFDCRFLDNPHWDPDLRGLTGLDAAVQAHVRRDARFAPFVDQLCALALFVLPACKEEGKAHLAFGLGCTGGQHRSVTVAETLARSLAEQDWQVSCRHRELERRGLAAVASQPGDVGGRQG
ncbi:RNase adapter RapZ [Salipiger aestuarii]|uniref:RNase adapter RapZ n=1 Tax=Salipiger aestuarii TaxID=568098 RepID=UPI00025B8AFD|nr:RNase adapter RapZ [Salipiger aestuarii]EIE48778.1 hypothetical protein C357_21500 [Citreicella sp. 357]